jgi:hypothetical protein
MSKFYLEQVFEIRFTPQSKFLDKRGEVTATLGSAFLNQWNITDNSVDFKSETNNKVKGFFSFRNMGFAANYPTNSADFSSHAKDFLKRSWQYIPLNEVVRIGLKTKIVTPVDSFNDYFKKFRDKFIALDDATLEKFGGKLVDLSFPLNFAEGLNQFNTLSGPVNKDEVVIFFKDLEDKAPEFGVYCEVDYFTTEIRPLLKQKDVFEFIDNAVNKSEVVSDELLNILKK